MQLTFTSITPTIPALIISIALVIAKRKERPNSWLEVFPLILLLSGLSLTTFLISFTYTINWIYGIVYGILSYAPFVILAISYYTEIESNIIIVRIIFILAGISFGVAIPTTVLPIINTSNVGKQEIHYANNDLRTQFVKESLTKLQSAFKMLQGVTEQEGNNVNNAISTLLISIENTNRQLSELKNERIILENELNYYKKIASISKEQAIVISEELNKGKYIEYIIGFFIGLASSFSFYGISKFFPTQKGMKNAKSS